MKKLYQGFAQEDATVMEMTADGIETNPEIQVPVDPTLLASMAEGDTDPMFVTIEVLNEGTSRNGRSWTKEAIAHIVEQINTKKPDGYRGHLSDEDRKHKYPEPQTVWLGAVAKEVGGKLRLFAKGYVLPEAKSLRTYLKKAQAAGKNVAVSVYGTASRAVRGVADMLSFDLESIDWARPGSEGVRNMGLFSVTAEMVDDSNEPANKGGDLDREEVLKSATASELKELNPNVVSEMREEAKAELEAESAEVVSEMTDVRTELGLDDESEKSAAEVIKEMATRTRELELDNELREQVESPAARKIIRKIVVAEMTSDQPVAEAVEGVLKSDTGQEIVREMIEAAPTVKPQVERPAAQARKFTKKEGATNG